MPIITATPQIASSNTGNLRHWVKSFIFGPPEPIATSERDDPQKSASLLSRLPFEIREQIWSDYLHTSTTKLVHIKAYGKSGRDCIAKECQSFHPNAHLNCHWSKDARHNRLNLLLTCRRIYFECAPLLYRTTLFDFDTLYTASNLRKRIPACHFANISKVNVNVCALARDFYKPADGSFNSGHKYQWALLWETLAAMDNLRWLRFELLLYNYEQTVDTWTAKLDRLLMPVKLVTRPAHFELILPFGIGKWAQELPCQVTRSEAKSVVT
ncbi:hypothetical protein CC79DRAFT_1164578 [Sarocladium strictum]